MKATASFDYVNIPMTSFVFGFDTSQGSRMAERDFIKKKKL